MSVKISARDQSHTELEAYILIDQELLELIIGEEADCCFDGVSRDQRRASSIESTDASCIVCFFCDSYRTDRLDAQRR